jgi:hypothetical protein
VWHTSCKSVNPKYFLSDTPDIRLPLSLFTYVKIEYLFIWGVSNGLSEYIYCF